MMIHSNIKETNYASNGIETESVEQLLSHIAHQTRSIDRKLTFIIDKHIAQDLQNYYNKVNHTLSILKEKTI